MSQTFGGDVRSHVLDTFLDEEGRIIVMPAKRNKRIQLLEHVVSTLPSGATLDEPEMNARLRVFTDDVAMLRRHLVDYGLVTRPAPDTYVIPPLDGPAANIAL
ncbi:DUF2087 domain-containing protein [Propionibacteriaceae bacterium Y1700]|uniref:DUF2087 domain-containing protein n=1 Tax=Microlunatus sp. Y1700 TaxID=3418487 RepID=UPI003DA76620